MWWMSRFGQGVSSIVDRRVCRWGVDHLFPSRDCSAIDNARHTGCEKGTCVVFSCTAGYTISDDRSTCVRSPDEAVSVQHSFGRLM